MDETVQLSTLLNYILQKAYGDLTQLTELLPRKTDVDRKLGIVQYARHTRQLLIRLLALVKWAQSSDAVRQCTEVSSQINHQSWVFVDTADQLAHLSRTTLQQAMMPNLSLAPAIDVMTMGAYPRLPTCIQDRIIPRPPLSLSEKEQTFEMLEGVIRYLLSREHLPKMVKVKSVSKGRVTLMVPYEFEVVLTVVGDDVTLPWRVLDLKILVGHALPGSPVLVTKQQRFYLHQLVQSRLCSEDSTLSDLFVTLHHFCLSLQLDCLHAQVERLSVAVCGVYMKVEEYVPGHHIRLVYWQHTGPAFFLSDTKYTWPRITLSIRPQSHDKQLVTTHSPPLDVELSLQPDKLSLQDMLVECIRVKSMTLLKELRDSFNGSPWEHQMVLLSNPPCLCITLSSSVTTDKLLLSIDIRMGLVVASLEGVVKPTDDQITKILQLIENDTLSRSYHSLPSRLGNLLCQLHLTHLATLADNCGLSHTYTLPLLTHLPHTSRPLLVKLNEVTYLVVATHWSQEGSVEESYHLLRVTPTSFLPTASEEGIPKSFLKVEALIKINPQQAFDQMSGAITVDRGSSKLKRKLQDHTLLLPSAKRLCLYPSVPLPSLTGLLATHNTLSLLQSSLLSANISASSKVVASLGTPCLKIFNITHDAVNKSNSLFSSLLLSYELWPNKDYVLSKMVFTNILKPDAPAVIIKRKLSPKSIGQLIQQDWIDKSTLLQETLELKNYIDGGHTPFRQCSIKSYNYETLVVQYGEHTISFLAQGEGVVINCPPASPHYHLSSTLQQFLHKMKSLPLLVQGLCLTKVALSKFVAGFKSSHGYQISGLTPSHLKLSRGNVSLNIQLSSEGGVSFCGITCSRDSMPPIVTQATLVKILQSFLELQLTGKLPSDPVDEPCMPAPIVSSKPMLGHTPFPIPSPRLSSPLPSIPSLPPPASELPGGGGIISLENPVWERHVTLAQLNTLLDSNSDELNPLEQFVGSLALLLHWVREATMDRYLLQQMPCVSVDRGTFSYRTETLSLSLSLHPTTMLSVHLTVKPSQENVWAPSELQLLTDFFHNHVVKPPFNFQALSAFMQLFWIPLKTLKACISIMKLQMHPAPDALWRVEFCLVVPKNVDLGENARIGSPGIIFRAKVLIFLNFIRQSDKALVTVPILHDPKTNNNFVAKRSPSNTRVDLSPALLFIDQTMRKQTTWSDFMSSPNESSLAHCVRYLLTLNIPSH